MQYINGITVLFMVVVIGLAVASLWSRNEERAAHVLHEPGSGCIECEDQP
ncbi:hypothetical protein ACIPY0_12430 [Paenarthrobacter nicotinovorans]